LTLPDDLKIGWSTGADLLGIDDKHNWRFVGKATDLVAPLPVPGGATGGTSAINGQAFSDLSPRTLNAGGLGQ
jgi:hypothetical protein